MNFLDKLNEFVFLPKECKNYKPKVSIHFTSGDFTVETASAEDLYELFKLRHQVFTERFLGKKAWYGLDITEFDMVADHLIVKHKDKIVGTYRLISSKYGNFFFSKKEFHHGEFAWITESKLELSRACISPEARLGAVIALLWRGIMQYVHQVDAKYLFGCSSLPCVKEFGVAAQAAVALKYLKSRDLVSDTYKISPQLGYRIDHLSEYVKAVEKNALNDKHSFPPLVESYLKMGAKVASDPAYDSKLNCIDLFTILKISDLDPKYLKKFLKSS